MLRANDFANRDGKLKVHLLSTGGILKKSDSFIIEYCGEFMLIDGGVGEFPRTVEKLLSIRRELLLDSSEFIGDSSCKLRINYFLTHFHRDHVNAFIHTVAPCEYIEVGNVYLPPISKFVHPKEMGDMPDSFIDPMLRGELTQVLSEYHPNCNVKTFDFGRENMFRFTTVTGVGSEVEFTVMPPIYDWGVGERLDKAIRYYSQTGTYHEHLGIWVINQTSMWLKVRLGENTFLFTGDTLKRRLDHDDEGLDEMLEAYGDETQGVSFLKYIHHGLLRDEGAEKIAGMNSDYIYFSGVGATGAGAILEIFPEREEELKSKFVFSERADITVTCSAQEKQLTIEETAVPVKHLANAFAKRDAELRVHLISPLSITDKNDSFLIEYCGELLLVDGGPRNNPHTLEKLLALRREYLRDYPERIEDRACKLRINYMATHFHADHVNAFNSQIVSCPYIEVGNVYLSPETAYVAPEGVKKKEKLDKQRRAAMLSALREYHHDTCNIKTFSYGKENKFSFTTVTGMPTEVEFTIYPPVSDIGDAEHFDKTVKHYSPTGSFHENMPTWVVNAASLWLKVSFGENSFLFTGDTMKRHPDLADEALDEMLDAYGDDLHGISVLKYIHHGYHRDAAAKRLTELCSDYIYFSGVRVTGDDAILALYPERAEELKRKFLYGGQNDIVLKCTNNKKHIEIERIPTMAKCYANDHVKRDGKLKIRALSNRSCVQKDDAFIIEYEGEILVIDGGMDGANGTTETLLAMRKKYLSDSPELIDDVTCKLKVNWMASHFHQDHVREFITDTVACPFIEVDNIYLPPRTAYIVPREDCDLDGDTKYRPMLDEALERYQYGNYTIHQVDFGAENVYSFTSNTGSEHEVEFTVYPPVYDWGIGERLEKLVNYYSKGDPYHSQTPMSLTNTTSQWLRVKFGENVFLFTGDTMKRTPDNNDESLDEMTAAYRDMIGPVSFMKYVHHGLSRDNAAALMLSYDPDYYLFTGRHATAGDAMMALESVGLAEIKDKEIAREAITDEERAKKEDALARIKALKAKFLYGEKYSYLMTCTHDFKHISVDKFHAVDKTVYVNDHAPKDEKLDFDFLEVPNSKGNDAFIARSCGEVILIDGGNNNKISLNALLDLRKEYCANGGLDPEDVNNKLRLDLIISHFHVDHVTATIKYIVPCPYLEIRNVYMPAASVLTEDDYFDSHKNGDVVFRPAFYEAIARWQPAARLHHVDFCQQLTERLLGGKLRIDFYAATEDWGDGDVNDASRGVGFIRHKYYDGKDEAYTRFFLSIATVNANCMWCKFTYGDKVFLFVGDTFKKLTDENCGEPMDKVIDFFGGDEFKCDVLKFAHHGHHRRAARGITAKYMKPDYVVFTIHDATSAPDMNNLGIKWFNCAFEQFTISTDGKDITASIQPHSETHEVEDKDDIERWGGNR